MVNSSEAVRELGRVVRQKRVTLPLTLQELSAKTGISPSHLGRVERGGRFPSAGVLRKIARPLGFGEEELFTLAGYLSPQRADVIAEKPPVYNTGLDLYVARALAQETPEIQRAVLGILSILKGLARTVTPHQPPPAR
jgi:transcriptional regulator with XRE-family HTH domain